MFQMEKVGRRISELRKKSGMTQMELANRFGITYQAVSNWERGVAMPDISNLKELAGIFGTTVDDILGDQKSADILLKADAGNVPDQHITPQEFNAITPLLPADKNMLLLKTVNNAFNKEEAELARSNVDIEENEYEEYAINAVESGNVVILSLLANKISNSLAEKLANRIFELQNIALFSIIIQKLPPEIKADYALRSYEAGNLAFFPLLQHYLSDEQKRECRKRAFKDGNIAMSSILIE